MLAFLIGCLNAARGKGYIPTIVFNILTGSYVALFSMAYTSVAWYWHILFCIGGIAIWKSSGWGNYFSAFNGRWNRLRSDVKWIDTIGYKLVQFISSTDINTNRKRGLICMSIRGATYSIPLFVYLGCVISPLAFLLWPLMVMQGVFYWLAYWVKDAYEGGLQIAFAELTTLWFLGDLVNIVVGSVVWLKLL